MARGHITVPSNLAIQPGVRPFLKGVPCDKVAPWEGPLRFDSRKELALFDSIAAETTRIGGTDVDIYILDADASPTDPLYEEPIQRHFKGPFRVRGVVEYPDATPAQNPEGMTTDWPSSLWVSRQDIELVGCPVPGEDDIVGFWLTPFWDDQAAGSAEKTEDTELFFNVLNTNPDGMLFDNPEFVGVKMTLARNTEFRPERRIEVPAR